MGHADHQLAAAATDAHALDNYWMPFSPNKEFKTEPRLFVKGEGMYLWADDGHKVLDAASGLFCVPAGHCRPAPVRQRRHSPLWRRPRCRP